MLLVEELRDAQVAAVGQYAALLAEPGGGGCIGHEITVARLGDGRRGDERARDRGTKKAGGANATRLRTCELYPMCG
ncbi:hypothetical protein Pen01_19200 [Phytomonospora endophytica]|nr:hypothetical protein Pen01_19200 [Phytomonospora endophytica]